MDITQITKYYGSPKPLPKLSFSAPSGRRGRAVERIKYAFLIHIVIFITKCPTFVRKLKPNYFKLTYGNNNTGL
jgi:hypothetical protein